MVPKARGDYVGLTDVAPSVAESCLVLTQEEVNAGPLCFIPIQERSEVRSPSRKDVAVQLVISAVVRPPGVPSTRKSLICLPAMA